jgi:paraquat-inducible protein B
MDNEVAHEIRELNETVNKAMHELNESVNKISTEMHELNESIYNIFEFLKEQDKNQRNREKFHDAMMNSSLYNRQKEIEYFIKNPIEWDKPKED